MDGKIFTPDMLEYLFDEFEGESFAEWSIRVGYLDTWTDAEIYYNLPVSLRELCADDVMNFSWWHGPI